MSLLSLLSLTGRARCAAKFDGFHEKFLTSKLDNSPANVLHFCAVTFGVLLRVERPASMTFWPGRLLKICTVGSSVKHLVKFEFMKFDNAGSDLQGLLHLIKVSAGDSNCRGFVLPVN
jgi:hypothetical protein